MRLAMPEPSQPRKSLTRDDTFSDKFRTGDAPLTGSVFYKVPMPSARWFIAQVADALLSMTKDYNWELGGSVTVDEAIDVAVEMVGGFEPMLGTIFCVAWDAIPSTFLECNGSMYDRVDYPSLYAVLDAAFIIDADTFRVPDLTNAVPVGAGDLYDVGDSGGETEHTLTTDEMPTHSHIYTPPIFNVDIEAPGAPDPLAAGIGLPTSTGDAGLGDAHNNMPPYVALRYVIWAR